MKAAAARLVVALAATAGVAYIGAIARGPAARPSLPRDLAAGAAVTAAAVGIAWALEEGKGADNDGGA